MAIKRAVAIFYVAIYGVVSDGVAAEAGTISLEWRPATQTVPVGSTVSVGLYAVSDDVNDVPISVMDVILQWDASYLSLTGNNDSDNPYAWLASDFPAIGDSGLNGTFSDGDAFYNAQSQLGNPALATPAGLLVTKMEFLALAETPGTTLSIPETLGGADTVVIDGIPGLDVHNALGSATIEIVPEPTTLCGLLVSVGAVMMRRRRHRR